MNTAYLGDDLRALRDTLGLTDLGRAFVAKHAEIFGDAPASTPAQDATALADCPFCGGKAERYDDHDTGSINEGGSCITCTACQASSPMHFDRKENLVSSWNDRAENGVAPLATIADKAREWASNYPQSSDGRNTFILFAEWVEGLPTAALRATSQTPDAICEEAMWMLQDVPGDTLIERIARLTKWYQDLFSTPPLRIRRPASRGGGCRN